MTTIHHHEGRIAFGNNSSAYDAARPPYPDELFTALLEQGALFAGAHTLEIGPGNGLATKRLLAMHATPLTLVEPDQRFSDILSGFVGDNCRVVYAPFEAVTLDPASFDLAVIATAYHWLDPHTRVAKLARIVKPGGFVALLWNVFQDTTRADPFHEATKALLSGLANSPSGAPDQLPFALDQQAREKEFSASGCFRLAVYVEHRWTLTLDTERVVKLYEGFSSIARLAAPERTAILDALARIAERQFHGVVERHMTSPLYLFERIVA